MSNALLSMPFQVNASVFKDTDCFGLIMVRTKRRRRERVRTLGERGRAIKTYFLSKVKLNYQVATGFGITLSWLASVIPSWISFKELTFCLTCSYIDSGPNLRKPANSVSKAMNVFSLSRMRL